jgi:hypothetical protein
LGTLLLLPSILVAGNRLGKPSYSPHEGSDSSSGYESSSFTSETEKSPPPYPGRRDGY